MQVHVEKYLFLTMISIGPRSFSPFVLKLVGVYARTG